MVQTRGSWLATSQICLISQCSINLLMPPSLMETTDFLWATKWMLHTIVSIYHTCSRDFFFFFNNSHIVIIFIPYLNPCSIFGASDLKLRWTIPCGPNSVITFPSAPWLKPWYWWSWPVLPLGLSWHRQRLQTLG